MKYIKKYNKKQKERNEICIYQSATLDSTGCDFDLWKERGFEEKYVLCHIKSSVRQKLNI
jgi:hypothetical protein